MNFTPNSDTLESLYKETIETQLLFTSQICSKYLEIVLSKIFFSFKRFNSASFCAVGYRTASVIIALTDGELRENQFDLAQREVEESVWKETY